MMELAGGEGKVGENGEGLACYLLVVLGRAEVVRSGGSTERRRLHGEGRTAAGLFRRGGAPATEGRGGRAGKVHWV